MGFKEKNIFLHSGKLIQIKLFNCFSAKEPIQTEKTISCSDT